MADFQTYAAAIQRRFEEMSQGRLFVVDTDRMKIWEKYLAAFPEGSDPIFRTNTEHDCSCCRHFIRDIGAVVAVKDGILVSIWGLNGLPYPYQDVTDAMSEYVESLPIRDVFLTPASQHHVDC
jgi:hypothetical protein